jgi:hypothetical protein
MSKNVQIALALLSFATLLSSCSFQRIEINANNRNPDFDKLIVGQTTLMDVLREYGPPSPLSVKQDATQNISENHLHYSVSDVRTTAFILNYWLRLPFIWSSTISVNETLIEFDDEGKVSHVTHIERKNIRPPFQKLKDHEPATVVMK